MPQVTFRHEVPFGHRLQFHEGKCRYPHGHNYLFEVELFTPTLDKNGFVIDFSQLKTAVRQFFEQFDHAFVLYERDPFLTLLELANTPKKLVVLDCHPTAENLAELCRNTMAALFPTARVSVTCHEQRDCWATSTMRATSPKIVSLTQD